MLQQVGKERCINRSYSLPSGYLGGGLGLFYKTGWGRREDWSLIFPLTSLCISSSFMYITFTNDIVLSLLSHASFLFIFLPVDYCFSTRFPRIWHDDRFFMYLDLLFCSAFFLINLEKNG